MIQKTAEWLLNVLSDGNVRSFHCQAKKEVKYMLALLCPDSRAKMGENHSQIDQ